MVKICAVADCNGGNSADRTDRARRGVRQLALFKVPKSEEDRKQWADLLQTVLKEASVVCEQHFSKEDVQTADNFTIEGMRAVLPRLRCSLRKGSLPLSRSREDRASTAGDSAAEEEMPAECLNDAQPMVASQVIGMTIDRLKTLLIETPLPTTWCWFPSPDGSGKIVFAQIDPLKMKLKFFVDINEDLSIIVRTADNRAKMELGGKAETIADIQSVFDLVKTLKACSGTGSVSESRSEDCHVLLLEDDYRRRTAAPRCLHCRKLRNKILKRRQRTPSDVKVRYIRCQREVQQQQRQYRRLLKKILMQE